MERWIDVKIKWQVEDGYMGKDRPHYLEIPDEETEGLAEEDLYEVIEAYVQDAFNEKIRFSFELPYMSPKKDKK